MRHRYRIQVEFSGTEDEAIDYTGALIDRASKVIASGSHVTVRCRNLTRWQMWRECMGWGVVLGVVFGAYGLYCIAVGWWR